MTNLKFIKSGKCCRYDNGEISFSNIGWWRKIFFSNNIKFSIQQLFAAFVIKEVKDESKEGGRSKEFLYEEAVATGTSEYFSIKGFFLLRLIQDRSPRFRLEKSQLHNFFHCTRIHIKHGNIFYSLDWHEMSQKVFFCVSGPYFKEKSI